MCLLGLGPNNQQGVWSKVVAKVKWGGAAVILGQTQFTVILSRSPSARLQPVTQLKHNLEKPAKPSLFKKKHIGGNSPEYFLVVN